jgi:hypothetical protein
MLTEKSFRYCEIPKRPYDLPDRVFKINKCPPCEGHRLFYTAVAFRRPYSLNLIYVHMGSVPLCVQALSFMLSFDERVVLHARTHDKRAKAEFIHIC